MTAAAQRVHVSICYHCFTSPHSFRSLCKVIVAYGVTRDLFGDMYNESGISTSPLVALMDAC